jgi:perosamine synthetase
MKVSVCKQVVPERNIPLAKPVFNEEMEKAAIDALRNEHFVMGESVYRFEEEFAEYCGVDHAVSTSSGTSALSIALAALGVSNGSSVITTPASFIATSNVILHVGALPRFADISMDTYTIDPVQAARVVKKWNARAIVPVHLYGHPAEMDEINDLAERRKLLVVEDACQAHGGLYKGRKVGRLGDVACFSFYPSKNMTVGGDGGMLVTNSKKVATMAAKLRDCGRKSKYVHDVIGYTARLNTVNAAIGRVQLKYLDEWNEKRRRNAETYDSLLSDLDEIILPPRGDSVTKPAYHVFVIRTKRRDDLAEWLGSNGIHCGINYTLPIHLQPIYRKLFHYRKGMFPASEELCKTCLSLPMYSDLSREDVSYVSEKIIDFLRETRGVRRRRSC